MNFFASSCKIGIRGRTFPLSGWLMGVLLLLSSCAQVSTLQTARTTPRGVIDAGGAIQGSLLGDVGGEQGGAPSGEVWARVGLGERADLGLKAGGMGQALLDLKLQVIGDQTSPFALAIGAGVGTGIMAITADEGGLMDLQVPLYLSYHPSPRWSWYAAPRYIRQNLFSDSPSAQNNYFGGSVGFMVGEEWRIVTELSGFNVRNPDSGDGYVFQVAFGPVFRFD